MDPAAISARPAIPTRWVLAPPAPAFYLGPQTVLDLVDQSVDRILDLLGLDAPGARRWLGPKEK